MFYIKSLELFLIMNKIECYINIKSYKYFIIVLLYSGTLYNISLYCFGKFGATQYVLIKQVHVLKMQEKSFGKKLVPLCNLCPIYVFM